MAPPDESSALSGSAPSSDTVRGRSPLLSPPTPIAPSASASPAPKTTSEPAEQSDLGRGGPPSTPTPAPVKGKEHVRQQTAGSSSGSPARPPPGILRNPPSARDGERHSSYASTSSSMAGGGTHRLGPSGDLAETESLLSDDLDLGELSDTGLGYEGYFAQRERKGGRGNAKGGAAKIGPGGVAKTKPALVSMGSRSGSMTPAIRPSKSRSVSRARRSSDDEDEDETRGERERAMSPAPALLGAGPDQDDEVERRDRGEELVRKRMKDRARLKKEAEKARKREIDARAARLQLDAARRASYHPSSFATDYEPPSDAERPLSAGAFPPTPYLPSRAESSLGLGRPGAPSPGVPIARSREPSRSGLRDSVVSSCTVTGDETARVPSASYSSEGEEVGTPKGTSPAFPGHRLRRGQSYASSRGGEEMDDGLFHDRVESSTRRSDVGDGAQELASSTDDGFDDQRGAETDDASDDDEIDDDGDVEYTLKDRQDAINVEHPFGLPIWKPALYKKSRSITRNAETALHAIPSSAALRHLAPGNILWTLFFGSWLFLVCAFISAVLWCTPWGGEKYGRVIWELGGYLFWPFGKYVEGWTEGDDYEGDDSEEEPVDEDDAWAGEDDSEATPGRRNRYRDVEEAGSRGRQASSQTTRPSLSGAFDQDGSAAAGERSGLLSRDGPSPGYGTGSTDKTPRSSSEDTIAAGVPRTDSWRPHDFNKDDGHAFRVRALGRLMYWVGFYLVVAPLMLLVCILCWGMVFTIPMAKLLWVLLRHLSNEPLSLHFRSPPKFSTPSPDTTLNNAEEDGTTSIDGVQYPLRAGQRAPRVSAKQIDSARRHGRLVGPHSTILLCTYRAAGPQYYKYTVDGVNIMFVNLLSLVVFVILDFWFLEPYVEHHHIHGFLALISGQGFMFVAALLSVIPLSYFIGMAVASISAQSSIGMGAVINASFGSIIEIILYSIALVQGKANLVEGSIVGSILAGVLLMPGLSMIGGAMRRKEQKFNARSAGVTSTMLIMAIIGILTPTMFYEIYGSFQLTCSGCDPAGPGGTSSCSTCYYEHVDPADDAFYKQTVQKLAYYCAILLVLSYFIGLWFSLRTHASQIWQNEKKHEETLPRPATADAAHAAHADRQSMYKRVLPSQLLPKHRHASTSAAPHTPTGTTPVIHPRPPSKVDIPALDLPHGMTAEDVSRAFEVVAATATAIRSQSHSRPSHLPATLHRQPSHVREVSGHTVKVEHDAGEGGGGHDAPNWSRAKSGTVLMTCTVLYAIIAEILVDVVDVVLDGSGIPEKLLGVTLFALVPNTTEFLNAIAFALNGNVALSMEIGSAYALQVCLIQAPAMLAFSAFYSIGKDSLLHHSFTLVFPRWDVIAIMFSVFLLTYTYIEARANYYRGSILCLSYLVLMGGFAWAPSGRDTSDNPGFGFLLSTLFSR